MRSAAQSRPPRCGAAAPGRDGGPQRTTGAALADGRGCAEPLTRRSGGGGDRGRQLFAAVSGGQAAPGAALRQSLAAGHVAPGGGVAPAGAAPAAALFRPVAAGTAAPALLQCAQPCGVGGAVAAGAVASAGSSLAAGLLSLAEGWGCRRAAAGSALGGALAGGAAGGAGEGVGEGVGGGGEGWGLRLSLGSGRLCVLRGRLAVVTGPAGGSIHGSEARIRTKRASVRQQAQGRSARGALLFGIMLRDYCSSGDFSLFLRYVSAGRLTHSGNLHQGLFHRRVAERLPLQQQVDPQHGRQWVRRPASLLAGLGVVGRDRRDHRLPEHHHIHLREKPLAFGLLLGRGQLVVREAKLLAAHQPFPVMRSQSISHESNRLGIPEYP
jgi:hypothetical protein